MRPDATADWLGGIVPAPLDVREVAGMTVAAARLDDGRSVASTLDFAAIDTGLLLADNPSQEVRCELLTCARVPVGAAVGVVLATGSLLADAAGSLPARPGVLVPGVGERAGVGHLAGATVRHGLLTVPQLWGGDTPQVSEEGRLTLMLEVLMITDDEYEVACDRGAEALLTRLRRRGSDLANWYRE
ncbi:suppressor of fused domain protein [Corynebacterium uterequi]|uniref:Suppressor of fused protein (SUFU) n=1 Tax=Corynebacterium uterequi TaxID=1072256 RepID=A0A0G3HA29_9CORY|nr:suppressor of fused domain protein [Corynebacterium uterequi]AKK10159.1 Suppressor of fused protein (SUFU) [Corynebacterium uterequi]